MPMLAEHRTEAAHLPHHPLRDVGAPAHALRQKAAGLVGQINQDRAGLEYRKRLAAVWWRTIDDRRDSIVRANCQKVRLELLAGADVDGNDGIGKPELLQ